MNAAASVTRRVSFIGVLLLIIGVFGMSANATPAVGAPNQSSLSVYLDQPFVQGSYVAAAGGPGVSWMNFNGDTGADKCGVGAPAGVTITGTCRIDAVAGHGGATPDANIGTATVGGIGSNFPTTVNSSSPVIINLDDDSRYMGLWWSAGSATNSMKFFNGSTLLLTLTTSNIISLLGAAPADNSVWLSKNNDDAANVITSVDGETKNRKMWYFGNPRGYDSSSAPTAISTVPGTEPFVYIHLFAGGNLTFDRVELSGGGFEFDNLALSTTAQSVNNRLVFVNRIFDTPAVVEFNSNASGVQGTMANQTASTSTALRNNVFNRTGYTFSGWNTEPNGENGTAYANAARYDFDANITLYAQWNPLSYSVTYDSQGGSSVSDGTYLTGSTITLPQSPTRDNFTFAGWHTQSSGGAPLGSTYSPPGTGNITLFAQWTENASPAPSPSPSGDTVPARSSTTLAATGSNNLALLGVFGLATAAGLALVAQSARRRRRQ